MPKPPPTAPEANINAHFTPTHLATLHAAVNTLIPPDDFPGGWEAGVGAYLAGQFEGDLRGQVATYQRGLDSLLAEAEARHGQPFAALGAAAQADVLSQVEQGIVKATWEIDAAAFFKMLLRHSMEGFYGDPHNGGNLGGVSWRMIGFEVRG